MPLIRPLQSHNPPALASITPVSSPLAPPASATARSIRDKTSERKERQPGECGGRLLSSSCSLILIRSFPHPPTLLQPRAFPPRTNARALRSPHNILHTHTSPSATDHRRTDLAVTRCDWARSTAPQKTYETTFLLRTLLGGLCNLTSPHLFCAHRPFQPPPSYPTFQPPPRCARLTPQTTPSPALYIPMPP